MNRREFITLLVRAALQPPSLQFSYDHHLPNRRSHLRHTPFN
jgi:hypothetical protein